MFVYKYVIYGQPHDSWLFTTWVNFVLHFWKGLSRVVSYGDESWCLQKNTLKRASYASGAIFNFLNKWKKRRKAHLYYKLKSALYSSVPRSGLPPWNFWNWSLMKALRIQCAGNSHHTLHLWPIFLPLWNSREHDMKFPHSLCSIVIMKLHHSASHHWFI